MLKKSQKVGNKTNKDQGQEHEKENQKTKSAMHRSFFTISRKHVAIGKGFMAAHAHDIRLKVRRKRSNIIGKQQATFLTFNPMRPEIMEKINKSVFVAESKCISSFVLPSDVHGRRGQVVIPGVPDVLADAIKKVVHSEGFETMGIE